MPKSGAGRPSEVIHSDDIPTATIEDVPDLNEATLTEDTTSPPDDESEADRFHRLRRPTHSEILSAVDSVNTDQVDISELARARAARLEAEALEKEKEEANPEEG